MEGVEEQEVVWGWGRDKVQPTGRAGKRRQKFIFRTPENLQIAGDFQGCLSQLLATANQVTDIESVKIRVTKTRSMAKTKKKKKEERERVTKKVSRKRSQLKKE